MPTTLTTKAVEQSTFAIVATFTDEAGTPMTPNELAWSLYKKVGQPAVEAVVNERLAVPITSAPSVTVVLSGDDLALVEGESKARYLLIEGTYDSDLGTDLSIKDTVAFQIANLIGVS